MLGLMEQNKTDFSDREWLSVSLAYFHGLSKMVGKKVSNENVTSSSKGGVTVSYNGFKYYLALRVQQK